MKFPPQLVWSEAVFALRHFSPKHPDLNLLEVMEGKKTDSSHFHFPLRGSFNIRYEKEERLEQAEPASVFMFIIV